MANRLVVIAAYPAALLTGLKGLYERHQLCDFCLVVNNTKIYVHSAVLFCASKYFRDLMESGNLHHMYYNLQNTDIDTVHSMVEFLYTGCLKLSTENLYALWVVVCQLGITDAITACQQFLSHLPVNVVDMIPQLSVTDNSSTCTIDTATLSDNIPKIDDYSQVVQQMADSGNALQIADSNYVNGSKCEAISEQSFVFSGNKISSKPEEILPDASDVTNSLLPCNVKQESLDPFMYTGDYCESQNIHVAGTNLSPLSGDNNNVQEDGKETRKEDSVMSSNIRLRNRKPINYKLIADPPKCVPDPQTIPKKRGRPAKKDRATAKKQQSICNVNNHGIKRSIGIDNDHDGDHDPPEKKPKQMIRFDDGDMLDLNAITGHQRKSHRLSGKPKPSCHLRSSWTVKIPEAKLESHPLSLKLKLEGIKTKSYIMKYKCNQCGVRYRWYSLLAAHRASHESQCYNIVCSKHSIFKAQQYFISSLRVKKLPKFMYKCYDCNRSWTCKSQLKIHLLQNHSGKMPEYYCQFCKTRTKFGHLKSLFIHIFLMHYRIKSGTKHCKCEICQTQLSNSHNKSFLRYVHRFYPVLILDSVAFKFRWYLFKKIQKNNFSKLSEHPKTSTDLVTINTSNKICDRRERVVKCDLCEMRFPCMSSLLCHKREHHVAMVTDQYKCPWYNCQKVFSKKMDCDRHLVTHQKSSFKCQVCEEMFSTARALKSHRKTEHPESKSEPVVCDICGNLVVNLKTHLENHRPNSLFCDQCSYATNTKAKFRLHLYEVHRKKLEENMVVHSCSMCEFSTSVHTKLVDHLLKHKPEKTIECKFCGKMYKTKTSRTIHIVNVHSSHKRTKLNCEFCNYATTRNVKLKEHTTVMHTHRHIKAYKCPYCDFQCATAGNINVHVKRMHKNQPLKHIKLDPNSAEAICK